MVDLRYRSPFCKHRRRSLAIAVVVAVVAPPTPLSSPCRSPVVIVAPPPSLLAHRRRRGAMTAAVGTVAGAGRSGSVGTGLRRHWARPETSQSRQMGYGGRRAWLAAGEAGRCSACRGTGRRSAPSLRQVGRQWRHSGSAGIARAWSRMTHRRCRSSWSPQYRSRRASRREVDGLLADFADSERNTWRIPRGRASSARASTRERMFTVQPWVYFLTWAQLTGRSPGRAETAPLT